MSANPNPNNPRNAGRKADGSIPVSLRLQPETDSALADAAKALGLSKNKLADQILSAALKSPAR